VVQISGRDRATLLRLLRRLGTAGLHRLIEDLPRNVYRGRGAPRERLRQSLAVALFVLWECRERTKFRGSFAKRIARVVEIKYARRPLDYEPWYRTDEALSRDVRRGLRQLDLKEIVNSLRGLVWWRHHHVNPQWPFMIGQAGRHIVIAVRDAEVLFAWIDAAILRSRSGR
jgi:hypothetical protein